MTSADTATPGCSPELQMVVSRKSWNSFTVDQLCDRSQVRLQSLLLIIALFYQTDKDTYKESTWQVLQKTDISLKEPKSCWKCGFRPTTNRQICLKLNGG